LRLPDWVEGLEAAVRTAVSSAVARGSVTVGLRLNRRGAGGAGRLDPAALATALAALGEVEAAAEASGVTLRHSSAADILALRGVMDGMSSDDDADETLAPRLTAGLPKLLEAFRAMRRAEGQALGEVLTGQIDRIATLAADAAEEARLRQ